MSEKIYVIKSEKGYLFNYWPTPAMKKRYVSWTRLLILALQVDEPQVGRVIEKISQVEGPYFRMKPVRVELIEVEG